MGEIHSDVRWDRSTPVEPIRSSWTPEIGHQEAESRRLKIIGRRKAILAILAILITGLVMAVGMLITCWLASRNTLDEILGFGSVLGFLGGLVFIYVLPTLIAAQRHHPHGPSIAIVNLFLGWTLVGWVVTIAWAVMPVTPRR